MIDFKTFRPHITSLALTVLAAFPLSGRCSSALVLDFESDDWKVIETNGETDTGLIRQYQLAERLPTGGRRGKGGLRCQAVGTARPVQISFDAGAGDAMAADLDAFTIGAWVKLENPGTVIVMERLPQQPGCLVFALQTSGYAENLLKGRLSFAATGFGQALSEAPAMIECGRWMHVAMTFSQGSVEFYLDGERLGEIQRLATEEIPRLEAASPFLATGRGLQGELGGVEWLFGKALTGDEIQTAVRSEKGALYPTILKR